MQKYYKQNLIVIVLILLSATAIQAQQQPQLTLLGVTVEGNHRADSGLIIATSGLVIGQPLTGEKVQNVIRRLWELELFGDVKVMVEKQTGDGVFLAIHVKEYSRLEFIDISGGKKIGKREMEEAIDLFKGQVLKPSDPVKLHRKLRELCEEKGYLLADIIVEIKPGTAEGLSNLLVRVDEGTKVKIKEIIFNGNEAIPDKKLRKKLKNTKQKAWFRSGEFHRDKFEEDLKVMISHYREKGYRDAEVLGDSIWYTEDRKRMFLRIDITEGPLYYFGDVTFSGSDLFSKIELQRQVMFEPGDVFNQMIYELTWREKLSTLFYDKGYIYTSVRPTETQAGGDTLSINFHIEAGNRFSVRQIHIAGNSKTLEKVIRREFVLKPGDTFDVTKLRRSIRDVTILNYFANVEPDVEEVSEDQVDLYIKVEEKPTDQANLSAGYSEQDGVIGAIGFAAPNFYGTGQQLTLDWNFGQEYGSFSLGYTEPWLFDLELLVGGSFYMVRRRWADGFSEQLVGGSVRLGQRLDWPDDYFRSVWIYRIERSMYDEFSQSFRASNTQGISEGDVRLSSTLTHILTRDSRDFPEFPTTGSVANITTDLAGGLLGGDDRYHKHIASLEWYTRILPKFVLYNSVTAGYLGTLTGGESDIPLLEYFYMGGSGLSLGTPLRGYDERSVGPHDLIGGSVDGGKSQFKAAMELRLQMVDNPTIYGLTFAEAGNTWEGFSHTDPWDLWRSAGFGVRLYMPMIGMIGLDFGYGFDHPERDALGRLTDRRRGVWKTHFQFGRQF